LNNDIFHIIIRPSSKGHLHTASGREAADIIAGNAVQLRKFATDQDRPIGLHGDRSNGTIRRGHKINLHRPNWVQPADMVTCDPVGTVAQAGEHAPHQDAPVLLERNLEHIPAGAAFKIGVQAPIQVEAADFLPGGPAQGIKPTAHQDLAIRLGSQAGDPVVCPGGETRIQPAAGQQSCQMAARLSVNLGKLPADEDFTVCLQGDRPYGIVYIGVEACIQLPIGMQAGKAVAGC
jgi:hypothetical protein